MKTREITQVMYGSGYAGSGVVELKIGEEWYKIKPEELLRLLQYTDIYMVATLARKYKYLSVGL